MSETADQASPAAERESPYPAPAYAWYCVFILTGIYLNSFLDRQILGLLVDPIKADMKISDTQMGFLMGPSFAIAYIIAGLPLGWLADRMSRRWLIALGQFFWSLASVSFGLGRIYSQLLAARICVGVGEASLGPSAYSLITDLFPRRRLSTAMSVYGLGIFLGGGLANLVGGYVLELVGTGTLYDLPFVGPRKSWQMVFFIIATPTIPLTLLLLTIREPIRRGVHKIVGEDGTARAAKLPLSAFLRYARRNAKTVLTHNIGFAWLSFAGYGSGAWVPSLFIRIHGWDPALTGKVLGVILITVGPLGILTAGWLADWLGERGYRDATIRVGLFSALAPLPLVVAYPLVPNATLAIVLYAVASFFGAMPWGIAVAAIHEMMPNQMRGQATAVYLFVGGLLGTALGPQIVAIVTDYVFKDEMMVHYSLALTALIAKVFAVVCLAICLRHYTKSLDRLESWSLDD